jgi:ABC-type methionine transport system permease subunit
MIEFQQVVYLLIVATSLATVIGIFLGLLLWEYHSMQHHKEIIHSVLSKNPCWAIDLPSKSIEHHGD